MPDRPDDGRATVAIGRGDQLRSIQLLIARRRKLRDHQVAVVRTQEEAVLMFHNEGVGIRRGRLIFTASKVSQIRFPLLI